MNTIHFRGASRRITFAIAALCVLAWGAARGENLAWDASSGLWSDSGNWDPAQAPANNDNLTFGSVGSGGTNTNNMPGLHIGSYTVTGLTHRTDLDGNAFTTTAFVVQGFAAGNTAQVDIVGGDSLTVEDTLSIGHGSYADAHVTLADDTALLVGLGTGDRAVMRVAENTGGSPSYADASLTAGKVFNAYVSDLYVGHRNTGYTTGITYGNLDLSAATNKGVLDISGRLEIGTDRQAAGDVTLSDSVDLKIGSASTRGGLLYVSQGGHNAGTGASHLTLGAGRFDAYVTALLVGNGLSTDGTIDGGNVSDGVLDVAGNVDIGYGLGKGSVTLSDGVRVKFGASSSRVNFRLAYTSPGSLTAGTNRFEAYLDTLTCGYSSGSAGADPILALGNVEEGVLDVAGDVTIGYGRNTDVAITLSDGFVTKFGDPSARVVFSMGRGDRPNVQTFTAGGSFSAYLTSATIGENTTGFAQPTMNVILDLHAVTNGTFDVSGSLLIGSENDAVGTVKLPAFDASAGSLIVGSTVSDSKGTLELNGTRFAVSTGVTIDGPTVANKGRVLTTVTGAPGGLDLADGVGLSVNEGLIDITFAAPADDPDVAYWGLRCAGNHVDELDALVSAGKLTWDDSGLDPSDEVTVFFDGVHTFVGVEPTSSGVDLPQVLNNGVSEVSYFSVRVNGEVTDIGNEVPVGGFAWWPIGGTTTTVEVGDVGIETFSCELTGLDDGSNYQFAAWASNSAGKAWSATNSFQTLALVLPDVIENGASDTNYYTVTLNGAVLDVGDLEARAGFAWWLQAGGTTTTVAVTTLTATGTFTYGLADLAAGTDYEFAAWASNTTGKAWSATNSFQTLGLAIPVVTNHGVTYLNRTTATLNGEVTENADIDALVGFAWWPQAGGPTGTVAVGTQDTGPFSAGITGLDPDSTYAFAAWASNSAGKGWSTAYPWTSLDATPRVYTWDGPANGDWFDEDNWDLNMGYPANGLDTARLGSGSILLDRTTDPIAAFVMSGGTLTLTNASTHLIADNVSINNGTLVLHGSDPDPGAPGAVRIVADTIAMNLAELEVADGCHTLDLGGSSVTSAILVVEGAGIGVEARLDVTNGAWHVTDSVELGPGVAADAHVVLATDVAFHLGTDPANRAELTMGSNITGHETNNTSFTAGYLFNAHVTNLQVATINTGGGGTHRGHSLLDLTAVTTPSVIDIANDLRIGDGRGGSGAMLLSDSIDLKIGSETSRGGILRIGYYQNYITPPTSRLVLGTGSFYAYVTELQVARGPDSEGILDASNVSSGVLDVAGDFKVCPVGIEASVTLSDGVAVTIGDPSARGDFEVGSSESSRGTLTAGTNRFEAWVNAVQIGCGAGAATSVGTVNLDQVRHGVLDIAGDVDIGIGRNSYATITLNEGFVTTIGSALTPVTMRMGDGDRWRDSSVTAGGTFNAYFSDLIVGRRTTSYTDSGHAVLDLTAVTNGSLFIDGTMIVCQGASDGQATVRLPAIAASADVLIVGDTTHAGAFGLLELYGTPFAVATAVTNDGPTTVNRGRIVVTLTGTSGGLDLGPAASLTVNQGLIDIDFASPPVSPSSVYWGLRWANDRTSDLETLENVGRLTWTTSGYDKPVGIFRNDTYTYVGRPPSAGTMVILR